MKTISYITIAAILWLTSACSSSNSPEISAEETQVNTSSVAPTKSETSHEEAQIIRCNGRVDVPPQYQADVHARAAGYIDQLNVLRGQRVKKGDLLATISDPGIIQLQSDYLQSQAELEAKEKDFLRKEGLRQSEAVSEKDFEQARSHYLSLKAKVDGLRDQLRFIGIDPESISQNGPVNQVRITAPLTGFVHEVLANTGKRVEANDLLFHIIDEGHKHIELEVFASNATQVEVGQKVRFQLSGSQDQFNGHVFLVNQAMDSKSQTLSVHVHPDSAFSNIPVGAYVDAEIYPGTKVEVVGH